jgi:hypothetical protein
VGVISDEILWRKAKQHHRPPLFDYRLCVLDEYSSRFAHRVTALAMREETVYLSLSNCGAPSIVEYER